MEKPFRYYSVIETEDLAADQLQNALNDATDGFPEKQIDFVVGTKIILGQDATLNESGRAASRSLVAVKISDLSMGGYKS